MLNGESKKLRRNLFPQDKYKSNTTYKTDGEQGDNLKREASSSEDLNIYKRGLKHNIR